MRNIVITGATSFIGSAIVRQLLIEGHTVYAVVRENSSNLNKLPKHSNLNVIYTDLSHLECILEKIPSCDAFFHFGWEGVGSEGRARKDIQEKNVQYFIKAAEIAEKLGCSCFIQAGSQAEYGYHKGPINESSYCNPVTEYGKAKLEVCYLGKELFKYSRVKYIHLRIFSVYGAEDHPWTLVSTLVNSLLMNRNIELSECKQKWNFMYIDDLVEAVVRLYNYVDVQQDYTYGIYNVASSDTRVLKSFVEEIKSIIGGNGRLIYKKSNNQLLSLEPNTEKLFNTIDWRCKVSFQEGIIRMLEQVNKESADEE